MKGGFASRSGSLAFANFSRVSCREWAVFENETSATLSVRFVPVDQGLKTRIAPQRLPNRIYLQAFHRDSAWSTQQSVQNFDCTVIVAKDGVNFGHPSRNFRAA